MYTLYYKKSEKKIEVKKARKIFNYLEFTEEVKRHNECYFYCSKRKPLLEKAQEIKSVWLEELEKELKMVKEIKL